MSSEPTGDGEARLEAKRARLAQRLREGDGGVRSSPVSFAQQRLWFLDQIVPGTAAYNVVQAFRLGGELHLEALRRSLATLVERQASLRTTFTAVDGQALQVVRPAGLDLLAVADLEVDEPARREKRALRLVAGEAERPFDLRQGPLFRATLVRLGERDHVLLLVMHHIVSDGWSMGVMLDELGQLYSSYRAGQGSPLRDLPIQYADFAAWQRAQLQGERLQAQLAHWRERLFGAVPLELPTDRPRPAVQSFRGRRLPFVLGPDLSEALGSLARREGLTLFMTLLAAFQALLQRYSGQREVVVGSPVASRTRAELEGLIGFFVNTLVLRTDVSGDPTFRELAQRVRQTALAAYAHPDVPFEKLVDEVGAERSLDRNPVVQVLFALQNAPAAPLRLPGLQIVPFHVERTTSKVDLLLSVEERGEGLEGFVEYCTDLFDDATIERLLGHYKNLLECAVASPGTPLSKLKLVGEAERRRLLKDWNETSAAYPERSIGDVFGDVARARPGSVALVYGEESLSYGDLESRSNRLARYLRRRGVGPDSRVGICAERSPEMVVGLLGILKAGGAYLPLDPEYPRERLEFLARDADVSIILAQEGLRGQVGGCGAEVVSLDEEWPDVAGERAEPLESLAGPEDLAYVTYTSGSTGVPKGVEIRHRSVLRLLFGVDYAHLGPDEVFLQLAPVSFDASTLELWGPLLHGGRCVLFPGRVPASRELGEVLRREAVTTLWLTSSLYNAVVEEAPEALEGVRQLLIGGEALSVPHVKKGYGRLGSTQIVNGYGPTEGTTFTCCYAIPRDLGEARSIPIGRPIGNTRVYLLDGAMEPVPAGVAGELYIGGDGLARGYLRRPDLTAEKFVPDPFGTDPGGRLYRSGDLARYLEDGRIEYLGRLDEQVKLRGHRIELGEIEAVLLRAHPSLQEAAVVVRPLPDGQKRLLAFLVGGGTKGDVSAAELRRLLKSRLPDYMIPQGFSWLPALPITRNGKVDREALARLEAPRSDGDEDAFVEPRTPAEAQLAALWADVLGVERVGVNDNFFGLGGDSILSIQLIARAGKLGLSLRPRDLFQHQTVAELARVATAKDAPVAERAPVAGAAPLTPIQRWFFEQQLPEPGHFAQSVLLEVPPAVEQAVVERALGHLGAHHEALRLRFRGQGAERGQESDAAAAPVELRRVDLSAVAEDERPAAIDAVAGELSSSLDFAGGPLWRAAIVGLGGGAFRLLWVIHHLAVDGVSWRILVEDLDTACRQLLEGGPISLPPRTTSFQEWARCLERYARTEAGAESDYWLHELRGPMRALPVDHPTGRAANDLSSMRKVTVALDVEETEALLREVPRAYGTRTHEVLLAALAQVLAPWTSAPHLLIDVESHGREDVVDGVDLSRTVGWFTAVHPVRLPLEGVSSPRRALTVAKEQLRRVPNRGLGYGLLRYLGPDPALAERLVSLPRAELSFNYLGQFDQLPGAEDRFRLAGGEEALRFSGRGPRAHVLGVSGRVVGHRLRLEWAYSESLHRRETVESLALAHVAALRGLISHCQSPGAGGYTPSDFPLASLDQKALDRLVGADRNIEAIYPLSPTQQGILFHARLAPESVAYYTQIHQKLEGALDEAAFRGAWEQTVERHAVLRTAFAWQGLDEPLQVVRRGITLPLEVHDWRSRTPAERSAGLEAWLREDRARRFDLAGESVWRVALFHGKGLESDLVLSFHHTILDGWSVALLLNEVFARYESIRGGLAPKLPPARPFQDYIGWLRSRGDASTEEFWREELKGFAAPTAVNLVSSPGAGTGESHSEGELQLSPELLAELSGVARRLRVTLNTLLQGAWALLLGRYSGEDDVVFGATVSGRPAEFEGVESAVGIFINTIPVRVPLPPREPVLEWLGRLQARQAELRKHEWSSLADVQRWSEVPEGTPLFDSLLLFENYPAIRSLWQRDGTLRVVDVRGYQQSSYPLTVVVVPRDGLSVRIKFDCRRFSRSAVDRMLTHYAGLLRAFVERPSARLGDLPVLGTDERRELVEGWNATGVVYPRESGIGELFTAQAERSGESVAVVCGAERVSYGELERRSNQLGRALRRRGVGVETRVGVLAERSVELVVGLLGVLKAGGVYVPLDAEYPRERLEWMVRDAELSLLLTQERLLGRVGVEGMEVVCLDRDWGVVSEEESGAFESGVGGEHLAYVTYTSGSTGVPKGVEVKHRGVVRLVIGADYAELGPGEVFLQLAPVTFDASTLELWGALLQGGRCVLYPGRVATARELGEELRRQGVTTLWLTSSLFNAVVDEAPEALSGLKQLLIGGEALSLPHVRKGLERLPGTRIINGYGPTEGTTFTCCYTIPRELGDVGSVPIGGPISNTRVYVLDGGMEPVPVGVVGELYIGGDGLARGYWKRAELTAERFVPDPFAGEPGGRLYRTGDLVRWLAEGRIEFLGRVDHQVKLRGYRIELGEIETQLSHHPAVREAAVVVREDEPADRRLVAYLVWSAMPGVGAADLRAHLGARLPSYMVPSAFVPLDALPLTRNGKLDRAALPVPEGRGLALSEEPLVPRTPIEEILAGIYAQVLRLDRVSVGDGFFDLGGHSLRATQVVSRIREALGVDVPLRTLFESPTVAGLALRVEEEWRRAEGGSAPSSPERRDDGGPRPLSFAQQRLWFLDQLEPKSPAYNLPALFRLEGALDADALARSFAEIQRRHEVLRTTFASSGGVPVQRVGADPGATLAIVELGGLDPSEREAECRRLVEQETARPFDLTQGPLVRGKLLRLGESEHVLVVVMHHAVSDGWSLGVFARELEALYGAFRAGRPSPLPPLPLQYADFASWQREWLRGAELESQVSYWRRHLAGSPEGVTFPPDRPRPAQQTFRGGRAASQLSRQLSDDLRALSRREGATLFMTLLAALDVLLQRHSGQGDVVVGTPIAGRTRAEVETLVGFFVNTLVLRTDLSGRPSFRDLLGRVRETALGAYAHQDLPFDRLVEELQPERDLGRTPLFQVMFNLVNVEAHPARLEGLSVETLSNPAPESKFDLTLYALDEPSGIRLAAVYNADLYESARIDEILAQLEHVLEQSVAAPEEPLDRLSLVTRRARHLLPDPAMPLRRETHETVVARLGTHARRVPARPAVVDSRRSWSYEELDAASSRLAGHLQASGVGRGDVVAVFGQRSAALVAALLGALKAGGAFLVLDPAYPALRTIACLRQAQPKAFLHLASAGPLAAALEDAVASLPHRVELPEDPESGGPWTGSSAAPPLEVGGDDQAYVAFTSGSTGSPRGILGTHAPLSHFLDWHTRHFGLEERDRFALISGLSHDPLLRDVFTPLWLGATLVVPDPDALAQGRLSEWVARERVSVLHLTPAVGRLLAEGRRPLPSLRYAFFGGDVLTREDVRRLRSLSVGVCCVNYYGATETPQGMGVFVVPDTVDAGVDGRSPVPLGKGIGDVRLLVLGTGGTPAGIGELGEIHVQTHYLAAGYLGDESLTRERFVPDPFDGASSARLYRTGDLGRYRLDGDVEYAGRADDQIKLRGYRVEPAEVEAALRLHPEVSQAAVVAAGDRRGETRLVAHVVGRNGHAPTGEELRAFLSERLPAPMVPDLYRVLPSMPLTPNGKVDRRALSRRDSGALDAERAFAPPRTPVEELLCGIWKDLLGVGQVGIHDDFFGLGGHSLLATQAVSRVRDALGIELPLRRLFEKRTVSDLAPAVTQALVDAADPDAVLELIAEATQPPAERLEGGSARLDTLGSGEGE